MNVPKVKLPQDIVEMLIDYLDDPEFPTTIKPAQIQATASFMIKEFLARGK